MTPSTAQSRDSSIRAINCSHDDASTGFESVMCSLVDVCPANVSNKARRLASVSLRKSRPSISSRSNATNITGTSGQKLGSTFLRFSRRCKAANGRGRALVHPTQRFRHQSRCHPASRFPLASILETRRRSARRRDQIAVFPWRRMISPRMPSHFHSICQSSIAPSECGGSSASASINGNGRFALRLVLAGRHQQLPHRHMLGRPVPRQPVRHDRRFRPRHPPARSSAIASRLPHENFR